MAKSYTVTIKLGSKNRPCHVGHQIGQEWTFNYMTPPGPCSLACNTMYPSAMALYGGGTFHWQADADAIYISCPDRDVQNIFELRRNPPGGSLVR